ncbi:MAG: molybdenum cofactor biosynthesis protein MoaE [Bacteroidales bacterium]|nr:molybdenum cofactor biosynthesis protein MoaE [Bacteroidales bacterium]MCU0407324.1 molybdenum cofactor biosynthesis protein MoaE [Bacteroidales bacterium]
MGCLVDGPLTNELIGSLASMLREDKSCGGHSSFMGMVRADEEGGRTVRAIEYSAHGPMAEKSAAEISSEIKAQFDDVREVTIVHSTGIVEAGELSLLVLVSAGHRRQAMEACARTVELVKERLPVWKKEIYSDNTHNWRRNEPL